MVMLIYNVNMWCIKRFRVFFVIGDVGKLFDLWYFMDVGNSNVGNMIMFL